jgi:glycosyltransferase involved in cell wall biosynthesis
MKVSCIMCTYRRLQYVERAVNFFLDQDYTGETELIIYNTDPEYPVRLEHQPDNIKIINNGIDRETGLEYINVGAIRRDALSYASGTLHVTFDDDDWYAPWLIRQGVEGILHTGRRAWKPVRSFFKTNEKVELTKNTLEASVIVRMEDMTFNLATGSEGLSWYVHLRDLGELNENEINSIPAYAFDWSDPFNLHPHRQSGNINSPSNFKEHKAASRDVHNRPIKRIDVQHFNKDFYEYFRRHPQEFNPEYVEKYAGSYIY